VRTLVRTRIARIVSRDMRSFTAFAFVVWGAFVVVVFFIDVGSFRECRARGERGRSRPEQLGGAPSASPISISFGQRGRVESKAEIDYHAPNIDAWISRSDFAKYDDRISKSKQQ